MELTASAFSRMFKDYAVVEGPPVTKLSGHAAGYMRVNYTHEADGRNLADNLRTVDRTAWGFALHDWGRHAPGREERNAQGGAWHHRYDQN